MVKRKRTLSVKDNGENVNQTSDADQICEAKHSKVQDQPLRAERQDNGLEHSSTVQNLIMPPASSQTSLTSSGSSGVTVPVNISQSLPNVPLPAPPVVSQARPTPQLRTSARVLNKQRREETKADLANLIAAANKKAESNVKSEFADEEDGNAGTGNSEKKRRRAWELWSTEDKNIFFESINECGKDFEAIQNYLTTKLRKKGNTGYQIKNKDQVRHFYYRTWHKISKHITFSEGVKKATQELYGLINYGELRKKICGTLDERKGQKLQELIRKGSTSVRVKGKSVRVRTPICRALKKLNQIEEHREQGEVRVPQSIIVEVVPRSVEAWCRVQGLAHNPRVRVTSPLQKPLSVLLSHLQDKWRSSDLKLRETLVSRANFPLEVEPVNEPTLRLMPAQGGCIKPLNVQPDVMMKSSAVSLQSHEARLRRRGENFSKSDKRKESKQQPNKASAGTDEGSGKDAEESEKPREQPSESERSGTNTEGTKNNMNGEQESMSVGKGCDTEILGGDLDDFTGEVSQEELEDGSDVEPDCLNSPDVDHDDACVTLSDSHMFLPVYVKDEPLDCLSPPTSILDPLDLQDDPLDSEVRVKEEGECGDALRQLLALETIANSQNVEDDADVICIGESTRLTAHVAEGQKGHSSGANQGELTSEERVLSGTPEPEEEEKDLDAEDKPSAVDVEEFVKKIRSGWVLNTVGGITVGELYLMFGQNKKVNLEYDFEYQTPKELEDKLASPINYKSSKEGLDCSPLRTGVSSISQIVAGLSTPTISSVVSPPTGSPSNGIETEKTSATSVTESTNVSPSSEEGMKDESENASGEKRAAIENLSGMLTQLLSMARIILAKPPNDSCSCGHVCGRGGGGMRSPAAGRGLYGVNRSPGNARSPRNCRITAIGAQSPGGIRSPVSQASRSPLAARPLKDCNKPSSAKKLIPDQHDPKTPLSDGNSSVELTSLLSASSMSATPTIASQDQVVQAPVTSIGTVTSIGNVTATSLTGVKVVVGDGGEFRVPTTPAPRPVQAQQASFNAQLTKLLPRYNNRPGRRVMRKSVLVQRQLPLLPKTGLQSPGVIAMKVLPQMNQKFELDGSEIKGYIPISQAAVSQGSQFTSQVVTSHLMASSMKLQPTLQIRNPIMNPGSVPVPNQCTVPPQVIQPSMPVVSTNQPTVNAISVNVSGQPLLTVEMPTPGTSSSSKGPVGNLLSNNSIVSGMTNNPAESVTDISDLLKCASPTNNDTQTAMVTNSPVKRSASVSDNSNPLTPRKIDSLMNSAMTVPQSFNYITSGDGKSPNTPTLANAAMSSSTSINGLLSSMVSEALSDLPDLSTPPGTPQPFSSTKSSSGSASFLSQLESISSSTSITTAYPCMPSPSLFNSSLSMDSLPGLNNGLTVNTQLVSALHSTTASVQLSDMTPQRLSPTPSITSLISSSTSPLSLGTPMLTTATTSSHLDLSSPPMQANTFSSLLNTPTPHSTHNNNPSSSVQITPPTPLSALLHTPQSGIRKSFSSLLDSLPRSSSSTITVPELHIPEGTMGLPLLDISIGGTVTLADQTSGLLNSELVTKEAELPSDSSAKTLSSSPVRSSTPTSSVTNEHHHMEDTSSDKLLDITLGISNSDSSFSSLLASATQTPRVLDSSILGALNMDNLDCGSVSRGVSGSVLEGISGVAEISGFPSLDTSTPSPPPSPSRLLQQGDNQWLNNEVNDFSLSSLLGHFESPIKGSSRGASQSNSETSMPSLVTVYNENSVDFTAKFAEMKAQASQLFNN